MPDKTERERQLERDLEQERQQREQLERLEQEKQRERTAKKARNKRTKELAKLSRDLFHVRLYAEYQTAKVVIGVRGILDEYSGDDVVRDVVTACKAMGLDRQQVQRILEDYDSYDHSEM